MCGNPIRQLLAPHRLGVGEAGGVHDGDENLHRDDLATSWLILNPDEPGRIIERRHCERCQPHQARIIMCGLFDTTVMLGDDLAVAEPSPLPQPAVQWLTANGWRQHSGDWYCAHHSEAML